MKLLLLFFMGVNGALMTVNLWRGLGADGDPSRLGVALINAIGLAFCWWAYRLQVQIAERRRRFEQEMREIEQLRRRGGW